MHKAYNYVFTLVYNLYSLYKIIKALTSLCNHPYKHNTDSTVYTCRQRHWLSAMTFLWTTNIEKKNIAE